VPATTSNAACVLARLNPEGRGDLRGHASLPARGGSRPTASPSPCLAPQLAPARATPSAAHAPTSDAEGRCDVSPRGDPAGFVRILDDRTLLIPERPGNRLADSLRNVLANPQLGLLFIVPGATDTFRVNGRAVITTDAALLAPSAVEGKVPRLGLIVDIDEAYTQCSKAFLRSHLWDPARFVDPTSMPTGGEVHRAIQGEGFDAGQYDHERAERYRQRVGFY